MKLSFSEASMVWVCGIVFMSRIRGLGCDIFRILICEHFLGGALVFGFLEVFVELVLLVGIVMRVDDFIDDEDGDAEGGEDGKIGEEVFFVFAHIHLRKCLLRLLQAAEC